MMSQKSVHPSTSVPGVPLESVLFRRLHFFEDITFFSRMGFFLGFSALFIAFGLNMHARGVVKTLTDFRISKNFHIRAEESYTGMRWNEDLECFGPCYKIVELVARVVFQVGFHVGLCCIAVYCWCWIKIVEYRLVENDSRNATWNTTMDTRIMPSSMDTARNKIVATSIRFLKILFGVTFFLLILGTTRRLDDQQHISFGEFGYGNKYNDDSYLPADMPEINKQNKYNDFRDLFLKTHLYWKPSNAGISDPYKVLWFDPYNMDIITQNSLGERIRVPNPRVSGYAKKEKAHDHPPGYQNEGLQVELKTPGGVTYVRNLEGNDDLPNDDEERLFNEDENPSSEGNPPLDVGTDSDADTDAHPVGSLRSSSASGSLRNRDKMVIDKNVGRNRKTDDAPNDEESEKQSESENDEGSAEIIAIPKHSANGRNSQQHPSAQEHRSAQFRQNALQKSTQFPPVKKRYYIIGYDAADNDMEYELELESSWLTWRQKYMYGMTEISGARNTEALLCACFFIGNALFWALATCLGYLIESNLVDMQVRELIQDEASLVSRIHSYSTIKLKARHWVGQWRQKSFIVGPTLVVTHTIFAFAYWKLGHLLHLNLIPVCTIFLSCCEWGYLILAACLMRSWSHMIYIKRHMSYGTNYGLALFYTHGQDHPKSNSGKLNEMRVAQTGVKNPHNVADSNLFNQQDRSKKAHKAWHNFLVRSFTVFKEVKRLRNANNKVRLVLAGASGQTFFDPLKAPLEYLFKRKLKTEGGDSHADNYLLAVSGSTRVDAQGGQAQHYYYSCRKQSRSTPPPAENRQDGRITQTDGRPTQMDRRTTKSDDTQPAAINNPGRTSSSTQQEKNRETPLLENRDDGNLQSADRNLEAGIRAQSKETNSTTNPYLIPLFGSCDLYRFIFITGSALAFFYSLQTAIFYLQRNNEYKQYSYMIVFLTRTGTFFPNDLLFQVNTHVFCTLNAFGMILSAFELVPIGISSGYHGDEHLETVFCQNAIGNDERPTDTKLLIGSPKRLSGIYSAYNSGVNPSGHRIDDASDPNGRGGSLTNRNTMGKTDGIPNGGPTGLRSSVMNNSVLSEETPTVNHKILAQHFKYPYKAANRNTRHHRYKLLLYAGRLWMICALFLCPLGCSLSGFLLVHAMTCSLALIFGVCFVCTLSIFYQTYLFNAKRRILRLHNALIHAAQAKSPEQSRASSLQQSLLLTNSNFQRSSMTTRQEGRTMLNGESVVRDSVVRDGASSVRNLGFSEKKSDDNKIDKIAVNGKVIAFLDADGGVAGGGGEALDKGQSEIADIAAKNAQIQDNDIEIQVQDGEGRVDNSGHRMSKEVASKEAVSGEQVSETQNNQESADVSAIEDRKAQEKQANEDAFDFRRSADEGDLLCLRLLSDSDSDPLDEVQCYVGFNQREGIKCTRKRHAYQSFSPAYGHIGVSPNITSPLWMDKRQPPRLEGRHGGDKSRLQRHSGQNLLSIPGENANSSSAMESAAIQAGGQSGDKVVPQQLTSEPQEKGNSRIVPMYNSLTAHVNCWANPAFTQTLRFLGSIICVLSVMVFACLSGKVREKDDSPVWERELLSIIEYIVIFGTNLFMMTCTYEFLVNMRLGIIIQ